MSSSTSIRWPESLRAQIALAAEEDDREFSKEVFYLLRIGLEERLDQVTRQRAYRARTGNRLAHVVAVYDEGEARAVDNFLKKHRAGK